MSRLNSTYIVPAFRRSGVPAFRAVRWWIAARLARPAATEIDSEGRPVWRGAGVRVADPLTGGGFVRAITVTAALCLTAATARAENSAPPSGAAAAFESTVVSLGVQAGAVAVPLDWSYTNRWDFPLVVEAFETNCGCLAGAVAASEVAEVAPGGSGRIRATFTPGPYRGTVRKSLRVRFVGHEKPVELVAEVTIPSSVELSADKLQWTRGGDTGPRSVELTAGTAAGFRITGLSGAPPGAYLIEQETLVEDRHHRLTITPADAAADGMTTLVIRTDSADSRDRVKVMFLEMRPAAETASAGNAEPPSAR